MNYIYTIDFSILLLKSPHCCREHDRENEKGVCILKRFLDVNVCEIRSGNTISIQLRLLFADNARLHTRTEANIPIRTNSSLYIFFSFFFLERNITKPAAVNKRLCICALCG